MSLLFHNKRIYSYIVGESFATLYPSGLLAGLLSAHGGVRPWPDLQPYIFLDPDLYTYNIFPYAELEKVGVQHHRFFGKSFFPPDVFLCISAKS